MIAQWQIEQFHQQGFLVVEGVLSPDEIAALQQDFDGWVEEPPPYRGVGRNAGRSPAFRP